MSKITVERHPDGLAVFYRNHWVCFTPAPPEVPYDRPYWATVGNIVASSLWDGTHPVPPEPHTREEIENQYHQACARVRAYKRFNPHVHEAIQGYVYG